MAETRPLSRSRMLGLAEELSFPRYPGTAGDLEAIGLVSRRLRDTGLEVAVEWFTYELAPALRALRALLIGSALLFGAAGLLAERHPLAILIGVTLALVCSAVFLAWAPWLEKLYRLEGGTRTANVVGRRRVPAPRLTVILLAHHDSKSQNLSLPYRAGLTLTAIGGGLGLLGLVLLAVAGGESPVSWLAPALGGLSAVSLLVLATLRSGNDSPGAVDNAGSVSLLVELARYLQPRLPADVELLCLSPGAEEDHMVGAIRWLDAHCGELGDRPVWALNFDGAGIPGRVTLLERYGFGKRFSAPLSRIARRAAERTGIPVRGVLLPPAMGVDAIPFVHRGIPCLTLASGSLGPASLSVHSANDRFEHLDGEALERVARVAVAIVEELVGLGQGRVGHPSLGP